MTLMLKSKVMKQRSTTPVSKKLVTKSALVATAVIMVIAAPLAMMPRTYADNLQDKIDALQQEESQFNAKANQLGKEARTLQNEIAKVDAEKAAIQKRIDISEAKREKLQRQIKETEKKIADNKDALGVTLADLYVDDTVSPLEMLASSENIGDYLDKQTYRTAVSDRLQETINEINTLKDELNKQKKDVERTLKDQQNAHKALVAKENEKAKLLAETKGKQSAFEKLSAEKAAEKRKLQDQQQAIINARLGGGGGSLSGGGSLASYASWVGGCSFDHVNAVSYNNDTLGYGCNQCVSYAAYMVKVKTGIEPLYWGNANMWPGSAEGTFETGSTPKSNSLGVMSPGDYGHIVYVKAYHPESNTVDISQYNEWLPGKGYGYYSERYGVSASTYDTYIYLN